MTANRRFDATLTPPLSDETVVSIHNALENYLHLFENHHANQIRRYYDQQRSLHDPPTIQTPVRRDAEPF